MLLQTLPNAAVISFPHHLRRFKPANHKPSKVYPLCCLRKNEEIPGLFRELSQIVLEGHANAEIPKFQASNDELDGHNDIWRLFREAHQNILYLNKQRLMAVEELKKANKENRLLLDRIEQLEVLKQSGIQKDKLSICWELLLRIDSMVLTGMISTAEASEIRKLVIDSKYSLADIICEIMQRGDEELLAELRYISDNCRKNGFHIIHICAEMEPLVSVGSVASYVTGISLALQRKGHLVEVILPKCESLDLTEVRGLREIEAESYSYFNGQLHGNRIWTGVVYGIGVTLIQPLEYTFFNRERLYGYADDFERFSYFSRASLDYIVKMGKQPDILHIHNWETAIVAPLFWDIFVKQGLGDTRILLTCHNIESQYVEQPHKLALCGLDPARLHRPDRLQDNSKMHLVNVLKGGIVYSNKVVILSSTNSMDRLIRSLNHGLEPTLTVHKDKLLLSPFGFDKSTWDPLKDNFLTENFNAEDVEGKSVCKDALLQQLGLSKHSSSILVGCIFFELSDVDLENMKAVVRKATRTDVPVVTAVFVFMDICKKPRANKALVHFQDELKVENVRFISRHDEALVHLIFAGSDIMLCQSFHDPVLQVPLKALKYGAAPVALTSNNTIFSHFVVPDDKPTRFSQFISSAFGNMTLTEALAEIRTNPSRWKLKMMDAMTRDFSWDAECYEIHVSAYAALRNM